ncbi:hypothetical protein ACFTZI_32615 [Streptomyces decoyicus]|uniref:hypothetical protein n=1 Tax=Streptomyces decoyicus TaxID=249567 RepID=UPI00363CBE9C
MGLERMWPWPPLPDVVARQLDLIRAEEEEDDEESGVVQPEPDVNPHTGEALERRVRPWDLQLLSDDLERAVYDWLDDVLLWHNRAYGWREEQLIPSCWPLHWGLALDFAAVAFGRHDAYREASSPAFVGRWHSDWEDFQRRMAAALGEESGRECRRGSHTWPGQHAAEQIRGEVERGRRKAERKLPE